MTSHEDRAPGLDLVETRPRRLGLECCQEAEATVAELSIDPAPEETSTLRGLAFSATGIVTVITPSLVIGADVVKVQVVAQEDLAAEAALWPLLHDHLIASAFDQERSARAVSTFFSTVSSTSDGSTPGRSNRTTSSSPRR